MSSFKSDIRMALKSVRYHAGRYLCFAVFLILFQSLLISVMTVGHMKDTLSESYLAEKYRVSDSLEERFSNYHVILQGLGSGEMIELLNYNNRTQDIDEFFYLVRYEEVGKDENGKQVFDAYLFFYDNDDPDNDPERLYQSFVSSSFFEGLSRDCDFTVFKTPLLTLKTQKIIDSAVTALILLLLSAAGCFMLIVMYSTMIHHFSYTYGIYMAFGAGFFKLTIIGTAELFLLALISFPVSSVLSIASTSLIFRAQSTVDMTFTHVLIALAISLIVSLIAVVSVMREISLKTSSKMIRSEDNTSLIASPRRSRDILEYSFPGKLEALSFWRYRKYYGKLILSCVLFASLFVCGVYISKEEKKNLEQVTPEWSITVYDNGTENMSPSDFSFLKEQKGVEAFLCDASVNASVVNSHMLIERSNLLINSKSAVKVTDSESGFLNLRYHVYTEELENTLEHLGYSVSGDMGQMAESENYVILSDSYANSTHFSIKPGDTVRIGFAVEQFASPAGTVSSYDKMLRSLLDSYVYEYEEFTVAAVISSAVTDDLFDVYLNRDAYERLLCPCEFTKTDIYLSRDLTQEELSDLKSLSRGIFEEKGFCFSDNDTETERALENLKCYPGILVYASCLFLVAGIMTWMLSQILFYSKRREELNICFALGAKYSDMRKLFVIDALFNGLICSVFLPMISAISVWISSKALSHLHKGTYRAAFYLPAGALAIAWGALLVCSCLSVLISFLNYMKKANPVFTGLNEKKTASESAENARDNERME